jgi:uncharacterized membrane protein YgaE (UPF0421/DUF939 family)
MRVREFFRKFAVTWSDRRNQPLRFPGLRILKTSLAVFLCLMTYLLLPPNFNAMTASIAAVIALKSSIKDSVLAAFTRLQSTFVGAVFGLIILEIRQLLDLDFNSLLYNLLLSFFVLLVIWISVSFFRSDGATLGLIILLIIAIGPIRGMTPLEAAATRFLDTLVGIVIALVINIILPIPQCKTEDKDTAAAEQKCKDEEEENTSAS